LCPPEHPPVCCTQVTITVPPQVNAKTAQRHDHPGKSWRRSSAGDLRPNGPTPGSRTRPPSTSPGGGVG
ncbi:MAG: hypothetical protein M0Z93_07340, partial [Actinomycetota bacterium]|nr:hypothetical protein [Actinomycetota bacterium]